MYIQNQKGNTEQQRKTTTKKHSSSYYDDLDRVLGHRPALRPPFASVGGLSVEPNQKGERVDRSSEGESGKADTLSFIHLYTVHVTSAFRK